MATSFSQISPFRVPSWRYDRVLELVQARPRPRQPSRKWDDEFIKKYRNFMLRSIAAGDDYVGQMEVYHEDPDLYAAHAFYHNQDAEWKAILEALILSRIDDYEIAPRVFITPKAVSWYEKLFFNVRDRLGSPLWVTKTVLGPIRQRMRVRDGQMSDEQRNFTYKLFAYFGGSEVLTLIMSGFHEVAELDDPNKMREWLDDAWTYQIRRQSAMASRTFEVDKFTVMELFRLHHDLMVKAQEASGAGAQNVLEKNIETFMETVQWGIAVSGQRSLASSQQPYTESDIEPRAHEQLELGSGQVPGELRTDQQEFNRIKLLENEANS